MNVNPLRNKITQLKLISNKSKIICITETYLSVENISNCRKCKNSGNRITKWYWKIRKKARFRGSAILPKTLKMSKLNRYEKN